MRETVSKLRVSAKYFLKDKKGHTTKGQWTYVTKECFHILIKLLEYSNHLEFVHEIAKMIKYGEDFRSY